MDGSVTQTDTESAQEFNRFFCSVFTSENFVSFPFVESRCPLAVEEIVFSEDLVSEEIESLPCRASPGPDSISNRFLLQCVDVLAKPLAILFAKSFSSGQLPEDWKSAVVSPIHKAGTRLLADNFRPVSLTSSVCKLMERFVRKSIVAHLLSNRLLNVSQFGFIQGRSCELQLIKYLDFLTRIVDDGDSADVIYLDFRKAFDRVPHRRLLEKLSAYGIQGNHLAWISSFLLARTQTVCVNGAFSDPCAVKSGVPQGSVIGPVLFLLFIDDIDESISGNVLKFADDTKIGRRIHRVRPDIDTDDMASDLVAVQDWAYKWDMAFNVTKFVSVHFGRTNPLKRYFVDGMEIPSENGLGAKDLGVTISSNLKSSIHVASVVRKAESVLGFIRRCFRYLDREAFLALYFALVRPILEYSSCAWNPHYKRDILLIERVQRRFTRIFPDLRDLQYEDRLRRLNLQTLEVRRFRADLIMTYKIIHGLVAFNMEDLFEYDVMSGTRGHCLKLRSRIPRLDVRKFSFAHRVVSPWNSLPEGVVTAPSLAVFKRKLHDSGALDF